MKPLTLLVLATAFLFTTSCGLSHKQKIAIQKAQQAKDDSIHLAELQQDKTQREQQSAITDSLTRYNELLNRQQTALIQLRTTLYTANDEMTQIKGFHFGRLPKERETQIQNQELKIQSLLLQQSNLQSAMQATLNQISQFKSALATATR